ncbi:penicillin-binding protein [Candidatus Saccharibacteria bacterium]|nr:penicillin-binding protein [Candidatus Saccharibacteria bacterium]
MKKTTRSTSTGRRSKNTYLTKSGQTIKINRSLKERLLATRDGKTARKAVRMIGLPKSRLKRLFFKLQPKRLYHYWFSRDGGIMALKITGIGIIAGFVLLVGLFAYFRKDLPNITDISGNNIGGSVLYYDRTGQTLLWEDVDGVKRIPVKDKDISIFIKQATVAVEDKDFFRHGGFDVRGIIRAGINDLTKHGSRQGGSTITQQLVRLTQTEVGHQQTINRKIKELVLAVELERSYNKQEILTGYLNTAPYGGIEYGVEAAANNYFNKSAKDLTLDEAAMLAAIPKSPSLYSKYSDDFNKGALIGRQHYILDLMVEQKMITKDQAEAAKKIDTAAKIKVRPTHYAGIKAPYFVLAAKSELENQFGSATIRRGGWKVITTLDMSLQQTAEDLIAKNLSNTLVHRADEEALVAEDVQTGQIVSLVGGTDFNNPDHGKINYAHNAFIPPGSSFKPYDYTTFIENNNAGAGSVLYDSVGPLPGYPCTDKGAPPPRGGGNCLQDYDFLQPGPLSLRYALGGSRNIPAVKTMLSAVPNDKSYGHVDSINKVISTASAMMDNPNNPKTYKCYTPGVDINNATASDEAQCYGASAIGDGAFLHLDDHLNGLATLARLGAAIPRTYILKIVDAGGKTVTQWVPPKSTQVIRQDTAYIVDDMASDPNASYLPSGYYKFHRQKNGWHFAIKTGTTNNGFDGLMTSWSTKYAVVTWVGNHTRNVPLNTFMEILTAPLAKGWMEAAHANLKPVDWVKPSGVKSLPAFVVRNHIHNGDIEPSPSPDLFPAWFQQKSINNSNQTIDIISNKLATNCTPDLAKKQVTSGSANSFSVDIFVGGGSNADTTISDDVHHCDDSPPHISIISPASGSSCTGPCSMTVNVSAGQPISQAEDRLCHSIRLR